MNRLVRIPRWSCFPVVVAVVVGLTATCYPGGLYAAYADLRDARELTDQLTEGRQTQKMLAGDMSRLRDRILYKEEMITALIRGETTLSAVTDQFTEMNRADETLLSVHRDRYGQRPLVELSACNVIDYVALRTTDGDGTSAVRNRLRAEFQQRFGHPVPGW